MKDLNLLVWITQLGLSVAAPLAGFILLARWLQSRFSWGPWVLWVGIVLGLICAVDGLIHSIRMLIKLSGEKKKDDPLPVTFNDHD